MPELTPCRCSSPYTFAADRTLGKLAKWLRLLGFDTIFFNEIDEQAFLELGDRGRFLLSRNRKLAGKLHGGGIILDDNEPLKQLKRLIQVLDLELVPARFFSRCHRCNERVEPVEKSVVYGKVPEYTWNTQKSFSMCPACGKIYWRGSHLERFKQQIQGLTGVSLATKKEGRNIEHA